MKEQTMTTTTGPETTQEHPPRAAVIPAEVVVRLNRVTGQLTAVAAMISAGGECAQVLAQLQAARKALDAAAAAILVSVIGQCAQAQADGAEAPMSERAVQRLLTRLL